MPSSQLSYYYRNKNEIARKSAARYRSNLKANRKKLAARARKRYREGHRRSAEAKLLSSARQRAKRDGRVCEIELADIIIPAECPVLGIPLIHGKGTAHDNSPTIDRFDNAKGYTKDNIWVISFKANRMKRAFSVDELIAMGEALRRRRAQD